MAPLSVPEAVPLVGPEALPALGRVVVVAPHPDDESLGCGGLIAHLAELGRPAHVVVVTDGTRSHPRSEAFPAPRLRALREAEARAAVRALGGGRVTFLRFPDCGLPAPGTAAFRRNAAVLVARVEAWSPGTLVIPWRRDPHCDHEASWRLFTYAARLQVRPPRVVEYPVWAWTRAGGPEAPRPGETTPWRLDVAAVLDRKRRAIAAHASQTTSLVYDDPGGFQLQPEVLALFDRPWEMFFDARTDA